MPGGGPASSWGCVDSEDVPGGGASSTWGWVEGAEDSDCSRVSTGKREYRDHQHRRSRTQERAHSTARRSRRAIMRTRSKGEMNERMNTSSRSPPPSLLWATDSTRLDIPGSCWCTYTMKQSAHVVLATAAKSYHIGVRSLIVVTARGRMLSTLSLFLGSR